MDVNMKVVTVISSCVKGFILVCNSCVLDSLKLHHTLPFIEKIINKIRGIYMKFVTIT